jgi:hypothetical protein
MENFMQTQFITKVNNGYVLEHAGETWVYETHAELIGNYVRDFSNLLNNTMGRGDICKIDIGWVVNPIIEQTAPQPIKEPEVDLDATIKAMANAKALPVGNLDDEDYNFICEVIKHIKFQ